LSFVDTDHLCVAVKSAAEGRKIVHGLGIHAAAVMGHDLVAGESIVDAGLKGLHSLPGDSGSAKPTNELFALPAEHTSGNHFDPSRLGWPHSRTGWIHCYSPDAA
jgi:hypothetical protein